MAFPWLSISLENPLYASVLLEHNLRRAAESQRGVVVKSSWVLIFSHPGDLPFLEKYTKWNGQEDHTPIQGLSCSPDCIYKLTLVEAFEEVSDSLCVPQYNKDGEERVILFLKMATNHVFSLGLVQRIKEAIRRALSARHVPSLILETEGIPYTINGKKVEVAVKQIIAGKEVEQRGIFSNPETLDLYRDIPELRGY
uniref:Uncharacterized protein n=1 Tax=Sphaerodactylus townsendi TaxID=933632 RepID=A0ACB8FYS2_9SAUR